MPTFGTTIAGTIADGDTEYWVVDTQGNDAVRADLSANGQPYTVDILVAGSHPQPGNFDAADYDSVLPDGPERFTDTDDHIVGTDTLDRSTAIAITNTSGASLDVDGDIDTHSPSDASSIPRFMSKGASNQAGSVYRDGRSAERTIPGRVGDTGGGLEVTEPMRYGVADYGGGSELEHLVDARDWDGPVGRARLDASRPINYNSLYTNTRKHSIQVDAPYSGPISRVSAGVAVDTPTAQTEVTFEWSLSGDFNKTLRLPSAEWFESGAQTPDGYSTNRFFSHTGDILSPTITNTLTVGSGTPQFSNWVYFYPDNYGFQAYIGNASSLDRYKAGPPWAREENSVNVNVSVHTPDGGDPTAMPDPTAWVSVAQKYLQLGPNSRKTFFG